MTYLWNNLPHHYAPRVSGRNAKVRNKRMEKSGGFMPVKNEQPQAMSFVGFYWLAKTLTGMTYTTMLLKLLQKGYSNSPNLWHIRISSNYSKCERVEYSTQRPSVAKGIDMNYVPTTDSNIGIVFVLSFHHVTCKLIIPRHV